MLSSILPLALLAGAALAIQPSDPSYDCVKHSIGSICQPQQVPVTGAIGDHIGLDLLATGILNSTGISVALREQKTHKITQLTWNQRDANGIEDSSQYFKIVTSHNGGIFYGDVTPAFFGEGQFPCSLLDDHPRGEAHFDWLVTHYYGERCTYNATEHCFPLLIDIPAIEEPRSVLISDNADVCGR